MLYSTSVNINDFVVVSCYRFINLFQIIYRCLGDFSTSLNLVIETVTLDDRVEEVLGLICLETFTFTVEKELLLFIVVEVLIILLVWWFLGIHLYFKDKIKKEEAKEKPLPWLLYRYMKVEDFSISLFAKYLKVEKWWVYKYMPKVWKDDPVIAILTLVLLICFFAQLLL